MHIEKAIVILNDILRFVKPGDPPDEHDAVKLGIEALTAILKLRQGTPALDLSLLPGEAERRVNGH
ncbi:hypothetical protein ES708_11807 [subsurface metagenome]